MPDRCRDLDLCVVLTYYAPYVSGLTEAARLVAEGLAGKGYRVRVVASRHDRSLPARQVVNGVQVRRVPVLAQVGKGTVTPTMLAEARAVIRRSAVANLHLPMLESGPLALLAHGTTPVVTTYQCDVTLPPGPLNRLQMSAVDASSATAMRRSAAVAVSSDDYADSSRMAERMRGRTRVIPPPCRDLRGGAPVYRDGPGLHVGFLGRIVEEKGLEYLVDGFRAVADPDMRLLIGGEFANVAGGSVVDAVRRRIGGDPRIRMLGFIPDASLSDFYASLDVFAFPSVNALEAFGIAQVEAMMAGVPVIASDLPGVRVPPRRTGMGLIVPPRDPAAIAEAIRRHAMSSVDRERGAEQARSLYGLAATVASYEDLFVELGMCRR